MQVKHPTHTEESDRGEVTSATVDGEEVPVDADGYIEVPDEHADAVMDRLARTYEAAYRDDGELVGTVGDQEAGDVTFDPTTVDGVGTTLAGRITDANDTVADIATGTDDQQPEAVLADLEGVDRDLAGDVVAAGMAVADDAGVAESEVPVVAPEGGS